jgi:hypothetical protein
MHSTIAVADIPSGSVIEADALDCLLVGEIIGKLAFDSPIVQAARADLATYNRTKRQHAAFNGIFERGFFLWPLNLTVSHLDGFFRPAILHDEEVSWGPLPPETEAAFAHISACFASIVGAARTNRINVVDMDDKPVHASVWRRSGITIDLKMSDLYEIGMEQWRRDNAGGDPLRRGLYILHPVPAETANSPMANAVISSGDDPPTANPSLDVPAQGSTKSPIAAGDKCKNWLVGLMNKSPKDRPKTKAEFFEDAKRRYGGISYKSFEKEWHNALKEVPDCRWAAQGRPKKASSR